VVVRGEYDCTNLSWLGWRVAHQTQLGLAGGTVAWTRPGIGSATGRFHLEVSRCISAVDGPKSWFSVRSVAFQANRGDEKYVNLQDVAGAQQQTGGFGVLPWSAGGAAVKYE
jgi:hypothetical protein